MVDIVILVWIQITCWKYWHSLFRQSTLFVILFIVDIYALTLLFWMLWLVLIIKLYFTQNWTCHPTTQFVLFSILRGFNFSDFKGKEAKGDFQPLWLKGLTLGKCSDGWIISFGLQWQPRVQDHQVILNARDLFRSPPRLSLLSLN